ncbi:hypothetical protein V8C34DRAFT_289010 [Trichoderma compactum]
MGEVAFGTDDGWKGTLFFILGICIARHGWPGQTTRLVGFRVLSFLTIASLIWSLQL